MAAKGSSRGDVVIASESLAARWMHARSFRSGRPLAATLERSRPETVFVANELLVEAGETNTLQMLQQEYGAELIPPAPIPPLPEGLDPARQRSVEGMPEIIKARLPLERLAQDAGLFSELEQAAADEEQGEIRVTSRAGAGMLALALRLALEERRVMLNLVGHPQALPATSASEAPSTAAVIDAYTWNQHSGPTNVHLAWQLLQAYEQVKSLHLPVFMAIMDEGFAFDANGKPMLDKGGQPLDVGPYVLWDMISNSGHAGGAYGEANQKWHGTWVFSSAAAPLGNGVGAAGVGGLMTRTGMPVVVPLMLRADFEVANILGGVKLVTAWGIDVLNMSFSIGAKWVHHTSSLWEDTFQFAADQGVIMFAGAGNDNERLPDKRIYPATRTPGVITVGATDNTLNATAAWSDSNYGSSVNIWAPGKGIQVMPDPDSGMIGPVDGTSFAAPIAAGVAALMLAVNSGMRHGDILGVMQRTAYRDPGRVTHALNAYEALLEAMGRRLPDSFEEPNHTPQTARPLADLGSFRWGPASPTVISDRNDSDWYSFTTNEYCRLELTVAFLPALGRVFVELYADDPHSRVPGELERRREPNRIIFIVATLAPGTYRVRVGGDRPNIYELRLHLPPIFLMADEFEPNPSQAETAEFYMKVPEPRFILPFGIGGRAIYFPGHYDATLHTIGDVDWFHIQNIAMLGLVETLFEISLTDTELDVALFGPDGVELEPPLLRQRNPTLRLRGPECWVRVSGTRLNRYHFYLHDQLNEDLIPGPWEEYDFTPQEFDLPYPPDGLLGYEKFYRVELTPELIEIGSLRMQGDGGLALDLIDESGRQVAAGRAVEASSAGRLDLDLAGLQPGVYVLRVGRDVGPAQRFDPGVTQKLARFQLGPRW